MTKRIAIITTVFLLVAGGPVQADQNATSLEPLFKDLATAQHRATARLIVGEIWRAWLDSGNEKVNDELQAGMTAAANGELDSAIEHFTKVIQMDPGFAEGWNQRATAYYLKGEYAKSLADIHKTLSLEPRHFGALSGMGQILLDEGKERAALAAFEKVLKIYPLAPEGDEVKLLKKKLLGDPV
ncbi:MAG: tetratricopeptide repeat protein [Arenicellales bacterium]|jgi:tetratricopeptide (TPR) repeat protein